MPGVVQSGGQAAAATLAGVIFGAGLVVSQMADPDKVLAFLTLGPGWDPSLALVMAGAVLVASIGYRLVLRRRAPLFDQSFHLPSSVLLDRRLLGGAALFGIGWGLGGYCPGPAVVGGMLLDPRAMVFLLGLVGGVLWHDRVLAGPESTSEVDPPTTAEGTKA